MKNLTNGQEKEIHSAPFTPHFAMLFVLQALMFTTSACSNKENASTSEVQTHIPVRQLAGNRFGGFDPGMTVSAATTFYPSLPGYFESCPDSPTGRCAGSIAKASGFYTISAGEDQSPQSCLINSGEQGNMYPHNPVNPNVKCPYYFYWRKKLGHSIARFSIDSLSFPHFNTKNLSMALQQNIPNGEHSYGGLNFHDDKLTPKIKDIAAITFDFRTKLCADPRGNSDAANELSHVTTYFGFISQRHGIKKEFALNLFDRAVLRSAPPGFRVPFPRRMETENDIGGPAHMNDSIHVNAKAFGLVDSGLNYDIDGTPNCSKRIEEVAWKSVHIDVPRLLQEAIAAGKLPAHALEDAKLTHVLMLGMEHWGRLHTQSELRAYTIRLK